MVRPAFFWALLSLMPCASGADGYKPFGIALGVNAYDLPGGYANAALLALGYKQHNSSCTLRGVAVTTKEEFAEFLKVAIAEAIEMQTAQARPDLAPKRAADLNFEAHAQGPFDLTWQYSLAKGSSLRTVSITFDGRTGLVGRVAANFHGAKDFIPDAEAMYINVINACGASTVDGDVLMTKGVVTGTIDKRSLTRIHAGELCGILHAYLTSSTMNYGAIAIENANPGKGPNPLGHLTAELRGNPAGATITMANEDVALLQAGVEIQKQVATAVANTIQQRQKDHDSNLKKPDTGGL